MKGSLAVHWRQINKAYNRQELRLRVMLLVSALAFVYMIVSLCFFAGATRKHKQVARQLQLVQQQVDGFNEQLTMLKEMQNNAENTEKITKHRTLKGELALLDNKLNLIVTQITNPKNMLQILSEVVSEVKGVQVVQISSQPPKPLLATSEWLTQHNKKQKIRKEGITLVFTGNYFSTLELLKKLESLPSKFFWEHLNYQVQTYPQAKVTLTLHYVGQSS